MLGWTAAAQLACVLEGGRVLLWNLLGACTDNFGLGGAVERQGVLRCQAYSSGLVVQTTTFHLFALLSFAERAVVPLADPQLACVPTAMAVFERAPRTMPLPPGAGGRPLCPNVVLATVSRTILLVDEHEARDQLLSSGPFVCLVPSPQGNYIAAFSAVGTLLVLAADFSRQLFEIKTNCPRSPRQVSEIICGRHAFTVTTNTRFSRLDRASLARLFLVQLVWCGADSVVLLWGRIILMVDPHGDSVKYEYAAPPLLRAEVSTHLALLFLSPAE